MMCCLLDVGRDVVWFTEDKYLMCLCPALLFQPGSICTDHVKTQMTEENYSVCFFSWLKQQDFIQNYKFRIKDSFAFS